MFKFHTSKSKYQTIIPCVRNFQVSKKFQTSKFQVSKFRVSKIPSIKNCKCSKMPNIWIQSVQTQNFKQFQVSKIHKFQKIPNFEIPSFKKYQHLTFLDTWNFRKFWIFGHSRIFGHRIWTLGIWTFGIVGQCEKVFLQFWLEWWR